MKLANAWKSWRLIDEVTMKWLVLLLCVSCASHRWDYESYKEGLASGYKGGCVAALYDRDGMFTEDQWAANVDYLQTHLVCERMYWLIHYCEKQGSREIKNESCPELESSQEMQEIRERERLNEELQRIDTLDWEVTPVESDTVYLIRNLRV